MFMIHIEKVPRPKKDEEVEQDHKLLIMKQKIFAPIIWCRLTSGFRIQDLKPKYYDLVLDMTKKYYMEEDVLCRASKLRYDFVSRRSFLQACLFKLKDTTSLVAIDESSGKDEVAGFCVLKAVSKIDFGRVFSRTMLRNGDAHNNCIALKSALNRKVDIYADYDCEIFLRVYGICIKPQYRNKELGFALFRTSFQVARALKIPIIMGIFDSYKLQNYATKLGFFLVAEIRYDDWKDESGSVIFRDVGERNETCALMVARVEPEPYPEFLIEKPPEPIVEDPKKKGKKDKKGGKKGGKKKGKK